MKKLYALIVITIFACMAINSMAISEGNCTVNITVVDCSGEPIIGANVVQKGTSKGTVTDIDGKATLSLPCNSNVTLVVSFIGYKTQEVQVSTGQTNITVSLCEDEAPIEQ